MKKDIRTINGTDYDLTSIVRNIIMNNKYEINEGVKVETEHFGVEMNYIAPYQYVYGVSDYGKFMDNLCEWDIDASIHMAIMDETEISWDNADPIKDYVAQVIEAVSNELNMLGDGALDEWFFDSYFDLDKVYEYCKVTNTDFLEVVNREDIRERYNDDDINENIKWWCEEHNLPNPDDEHFDMKAEYKEVEFDDPYKDALDVDKINFKAYAEELIHTGSTTFNVCGREYEIATYEGYTLREFTTSVDNDYDEVEVSIDNIDEVIDYLRDTYADIINDFNLTCDYIADTFYECCDAVEDNEIHHAFDNGINFNFGFNPEWAGYYIDQNFFMDGGYIRINEDGTVNTSAWGNFDSVESMINYRANKFFERWKVK